jgi:hypothetical protein
MNLITYTPPPTIRAFIKDHRVGDLFYSWIVGPVGSGKTTGLFFKLAYMASLQAPSADGIKRTRAVIVRNTMPQLKDTTLVSWGYWFKDGKAGSWNATDKIFTLRWGNIECIVMFRALDTPEDVARVLSLEINFAIIDEFVEIPRAIIDALSARVGRYKQPDGVPVTIWGIWGSSNPSTEDSWWFDYLHNTEHASVRRGFKSKVAQIEYDQALLEQFDQLPNATYYHQPGGREPDAENLANLPGGSPTNPEGGRRYYTSIANNKSEAWVRQFIDAEWGFSVAGKSVVSGFRADQHVSKHPLQYNPWLPLVIGLDPGIVGSAMIGGQLELDGRLKVLFELVQQGYGAERLIKERLAPLLRVRFPEIQEVIIAPDPAAGNRTQTDEATVVKVFQKHFKVVIEGNNRLPLRLDAIDYYMSNSIEGFPALSIDPSCKILIRALKGGWRYASDIKKDILKGAEPDKNQYSHPGDGFGYLCRYFHRGMQREERYGKPRFGSFGKPVIARPPGFGSYHIR